MNTETSALSYWAFLDTDILPYQEISDEEDVGFHGNHQDGDGGCASSDLDDERRLAIDLLVLENDDKKSVDKKGVEDNAAGQGVQMNARYNHAINLAPGCRIAYKMR